MNPMPTPNICGVVRKNPKLAPEAISIRLFGPGVMELTKQKLASAVRSSIVIGKWIA